MIVFGLTLQGFEPTIYCTRGERTNRCGFLSWVLKVPSNANIPSCFNYGHYRWSSKGCNIINLFHQHFCRGLFLCSMIWYKRWLFILLILKELLIWYDWFIVFNATFSNISAISWRPVLVVVEARVPRENHWPWASNW